MAYTKQKFSNGQVLDASKLNHIEDGIEALDVDKVSTADLATAVSSAIAQEKANGAFIPVKGVDYFTDADRETIVQEVITALGTPVFGTVDADNNIVLKGDLASGTYTLKYEDAGGSATVIGVLNTASYTNQIPISTDTDGSIYNGTGYKESTRGSSDGSITEVTTGTNPTFTTGFIPCKQGDTIRLKNCYIHAHGTNASYEAIYGNGAYGLRSGLYNSSKAKIGVFSWGNLSQGNDTEYITYTQNGNDYKLTEFTVALANTAYIRLTLATDSNPADAIVTVNQAID